MAENKRDGDDGEGMLASLLVLLSVSALSPLFSIGIHLLSFISVSSPLSLFSGFSSYVLPCSADLVCRSSDDLREMMKTLASNTVTLQQNFMCFQ